MRAPAFLTLLIGFALIFGACSNPAAASTAPTEPPAATDAPSEAPSEAPSAPAEPMKVGYISLGESIPFVSLVTNGIKWDTGLQILLLLFAAVTLGGLGTAFGALVGLTCQ